MPRTALTALLVLACLLGCEDSSSSSGSSSSTTPTNSTGTPSTPAPTPTPTPTPMPNPAPTPTGPDFVVAPWLPYWSTTATKNSFYQNMGTITTAHVFWYYVKSDGTIGTHTSAWDQQLIDDARLAGIEIIPSIATGDAHARLSTVIADPVSRAAHVQEIVSLVLAEDHDGIDIDYEGFASTDRDNFSLFMAELSTALHAYNKLVTVCVIGKTSEPGGWAGAKANDYAALGAVVDRVNIMGYGYGYSGGPPNPIGPVHWLERVVDFAISQMPPHKVIMGTNFYGRDWPSGQNGSAVLHSNIQSLIATHNPVISLDPNDGESTFQYTAGGVSHTVWYPNPAGLQHKLDIVTSRGIGGLAIWKQGGEDPGMWPVIHQNLRP